MAGSVAPEAAWAGAVAAADLFDHPEWIGTRVKVDIYEPLLDDQHASAVPPGGYVVSFIDIAHSLELVSGRAKLGSLVAPIRVGGALTRTTFGRRITVDAITPLLPPAPTRIADPDELTADPARWHHIHVDVEGTWRAGFEVSRLGEHVWLEAYPDVTIVCPPQDAIGPRDSRQARVRVVGRAYTRGGYGHRNRYGAVIIASRIVYLDPRRADCR